MGDAALAMMSQRLIPYCIGMMPSFRVGQHHRLIASKLEAVERGEIDRLMILAPPRHGKSLLTSEYFPSWYLGKNPGHQVMHITYGQDLASSFGRKIRNILLEPSFKSTFPICNLSQDSQSASQFATNEKGIYTAIGVGGACTGLGADCLILDDPLKNRQDAESKTIRQNLLDFYKSTAFTRLMPGGRIVLIQTRWHPEDLAGYLLDTEGDQWTVINLPALAEENDLLGRLPGQALWPEQFDEKALERIRNTIGEREFASLYQQRPVPVSGNIVKREHLKYEKKPHGARITLGVDLAISEKEDADYTAIVATGKDHMGRVFQLDCIKERSQFHGVIQLIMHMAEKHKPEAIAIEQVQYQAAVIQELLRTTSLPIIGVRPERDKLTRFYPLLLRYEAGMVFHDPGLPRFFEEDLLMFPADGRDVVDAASYAYMAHENLIQNRTYIPASEFSGDSDTGY